MQPNLPYFSSSLLTLGSFFSPHFIIIIILLIRVGFILYIISKGLTWCLFGLWLVELKFSVVVVRNNPTEDDW